MRTASNILRACLGHSRVLSGCIFCSGPAACL